MRLTAILLIASAGLVLNAATASRDAVRGDVARLQGTWSIVSVKIDGQPLNMDMLKAAKLSIRGASYSFRLDQTVWELTFQVDESKTPKAIDLYVVKGPEQGKTYHGIYKLDDEVYTICRTIEPGKDRPRTFGTAPDSGLIMVVWRHVVRPPMELKGR